MSDPNRLAVVRAEVDRIVGLNDDEAQHYYEDRLLKNLVREYCPFDIAAEVERLDDADFDRWYA